MRSTSSSRRCRAIAFRAAQFTRIAIAFGAAAGFAPYDDVDRRLSALPPIQVPAITLDGKADGVVPATDDKSSAPKFTGLRSHRVIDGAGHNLPEEAPKEFADAVAELAARA